MTNPVCEATAAAQRAIQQSPEARGSKRGRPSSVPPLSLSGSDVGDGPRMPSPGHAGPSTGIGSMDNQDEPVRDDGGSMVPPGFDANDASDSSSQSSENASLPCDDDTFGSAAGAGIQDVEADRSTQAPPRNTLDAWAHWVLTSRLSNSQINALFDLMHDEELDIRDVLRWKNVKDVHAYAESKRPDSHRRWQRRLVRSQDKAWLEYWACDGLIALQDLLAHPLLAARMCMVSKPLYDGEKRVYTTPETGKWWEELQAEVRKVDPLGVVAALILASDETHMDHRGKAKGHPLYLTLANIDKDDRWKPYGHVLLALLPEFPPEYSSLDRTHVFHYVMNEVIAGLKRASHTGIKMKNSKGETINVWPSVYAHVTDYPDPKSPFIILSPLLSITDPSSHSLTPPLIL
ncbi:unnamed protein product [Closterium sp. Naga37s-1]|nr:unnamed protein product [Closterium sp. Naga37s-1]